MALHIEDDLSQVLGETEYSERHDIWLWYTLSFFETTFNPNDYFDTGMREKMASYLKTRPWRVGELLKERQKQLVHKKDIEWIIEDRRATEWATREIQISTEHSQLNYYFYLSGKDLPLAILDVWQKDITQKTTLLRHLEQRWKRHKTNDKMYAWFKGDDQKSQFAWDWLTKNLFAATLGFTPFEKFEDLLIFFDRANYSQEQKELYIGKIKKGWTQKKYRENLKGKAQYNFVLSDKAIESLEKLASHHEVSRARILEILIEMETEKNDHIPERIRTSQLLKNL
ncbi:hypothetical protein QF008_000082 [Pseudomonas protegens]|uniref:hypothetical protein n=1 Tax=Pseudomonas TaxID=286 RepID=UPI000BFE065A|nr:MULTISPECIES: hypothetical protein [Pseudomonas]ATN10582.1 hypothetical protein CRN80_13350 [Pseudomonas sp. FDAARGOS_380]AZE69396.1 hypothetical protein C4K01_5239 [Pseudomonas synxantha]MDT3418351.1 hypothetical protein [Pseudomonas protegens]